MAEAVQTQVETPAPPASTPVDPYDLGDTSITYELPRDDKGRFLPKEGAAAAPVAAPPVPVAPTHPKYLVEQARFFGYSDEDVAEMPTEHLSRAVSASWRQHQSYQTQMVQQQDRMRQEIPQPEPRVAAPPPDEWATLEKGLEPYDAPVKDALRRTIKEAREARAEAKAAREQLALEFETRDKAAKQKQTATSAQLLDMAFARLAEKDPRYKALFGSASAGTLNNQCPEMHRRRAAMHAAGVNLEDVNPQTIVGQLRAAADLWHVPEPETPPTPAAAPNPYAAQPRTAPVNGAITTEQWDRSGVARPSQRNGSAEPKGRDKAVENLTTRMREAGQLENDPEILDGLL